MNRNRFWRLVRIRRPLELLIEYRYNPKGVLHIGAHLCEENEFYISLGVMETFWVEANPLLIEFIPATIQSERIMFVACTETTGDKRVLHVSNNSVSSSLLNSNSIFPWKEITTNLEIEVPTMRLDDILKTWCLPNSSAPIDVLIVDVQGAELSVLESGREILNQFEFVVIEVSVKSLYVGGCDQSEIIDFMRKLNFGICGKFIDSTTGHGDILFHKRKFRGMISFRILKVTLIRFFLTQIQRVRKKFVK